MLISGVGQRTKITPEAPYENAIFGIFQFLGSMYNANHLAVPSSRDNTKLSIVEYGKQYTYM